MKTVPKNRSLGTFLGENDALRPLLKQARHINALQHVYLDALATLVDEDLPLRESFVRASRVSALVGSTLVVGTASAAVATRLKPLVPRLLKQIQMKEQEVTEIRIELQPGWAAHDSPAGRRPVAREPVPAPVLDKLAEGLSDSPLKDVVESIRRHRARQATKTTKRE
ncbi:MAG: DUF721 domain-containing protein [Betaproteobacteria bacterium]|nr:DUF721 domain-containing protein [Betaproteobacteria bacterium]